MAKTAARFLKINIAILFSNLISCKPDLPHVEALLRRKQLYIRFLHIYVRGCGNYQTGDLLELQVGQEWHLLPLWNQKSTEKELQALHSALARLICKRLLCNRPKYCSLKSQNSDFIQLHWASKVVLPHHFMLSTLRVFFYLTLSINWCREKSFSGLWQLPSKAENIE